MSVAALWRLSRSRTYEDQANLGNAIEPGNEGPIRAAQGHVIVRSEGKLSVDAFCALFRCSFLGRASPSSSRYCLDTHLYYNIRIGVHMSPQRYMMRQPPDLI